jgi:hypothetical protein
MLMGNLWDKRVWVTFCGLAPAKSNPYSLTECSLEKGVKWPGWVKKKAEGDIPQLDHDPSRIKGWVRLDIPSHFSGMNP